MITITVALEHPLALMGVQIIKFQDGSGNYLELPALTTTQRNGLTPSNGMFIYNTTTSQIEAYTGGSWTGWTGNITAGANIADHTVVRGDGGAKGVQDSGVTIDDSDNITGVAALTLGDVLTFSDGATIDNSDATTLQLTETNIDLVGACAADALTLSDVLTFSDGATIDNTDASTLTITETNVVIAGNLDVTGTTTTINSTTLQVDDKNIELGTVTTPSDTTADGGGITLKGATDKTIIWDNANDNWTFNQAVNIASGLDFKVNNISVLNATTLGGAVVSSSLTSVGTLTSLSVSGATTFYGGSTIIGYDVGAAMTIATSDTTGIMAITHAGSGVTVTWTAPSFDFVGAFVADALTLSDVLTFSDGATIDNSDATTLQLTETNIDLVGACTADTLTLSDVLTFSDGGTIDNTDATTLTITETNVAIAGITTFYGASTGIGYDVGAALSIAVSDTTGVTAITHAGGGVTVTWTAPSFDFVGAIALDATTLSDVLTFSDGATIDNSDATTLTLTETTIAVAGILTVSGASTLSSTLTVGVDDTGHDVKFFGATSGAYFLFDESADAVVLQGGATKQMELRFMEDTDNGTNYVAFKAPATLAANVTLVLPPTDGDVNQYLKTDGSGVLTWATPAGAGDVTKVGTPVDNEIGVWTGDGSIEGDTDFQWDGSAFKMLGTVFIKEQADAAADVAGYGQIWVNTATPNELWFTNDAGTDVQLGVGEVTKSGTPANDQIAVWTGDGPIEGTADLTFASSQLVVLKTAIGVTQGDYGLNLLNTTDAAAGAQQYSPPIRWRGEGWKTDATAASQTVDFRAFVRPIQGAAAPTGGLDFQASINGGAYSNLLTVLSNGNVGIGTTAPSNTLEVVAGGTDTATFAIIVSFTDQTAYGPIMQYRKSHNDTLGTKTPTIDGETLGLFQFQGVDSGSNFDQGAYIQVIQDGAASTNVPAEMDFVTYDGTAANVNQLVLQSDGDVIMSAGNVGIGTINPGQILDCNDGSGNMIADGYDSHPSIHALKENAVALTGAGMIDKLKSFKLFEFTRRPYVSADELRTAAIKHFSPGRWVEAFGGQVVEDESGIKRIEGDDYRAGKLYTCSDGEMLTFLDSTAEKLRVERRKLPEWQRKELGFIIDDPGTKEALGDVIHYDETGKTTGYSLNSYVGFLHGVILELVNRVESLEAI